MRQKCPESFLATDFKGNEQLAIPAYNTARAALVVGKTFPAFPAHAQPAMLRIWQETHSTGGRGGGTEYGDCSYSARTSPQG